MKKNIKTLTLVAAASSLLFLVGCSPVVKDEIKEIGPNETAFLIKMDGTDADQTKFQSEEFLNKNRIASKRVVIPHKLVDVCHNCSTSHEWVDVAEFRLITINRAPVTREWTSSATTGTSPSNQAFHVESNESIDFTIGANLTAHISEADAAKFLYHYGGAQLDKVVDSDVRGFISSSLSQQFGSQTLDYGRANKVAIFNKAFADAKANFAPLGITIDRLGFTEGMTYTDDNIQKAINKKFAADMQVQIAQRNLEAAEITAKAGDAVKVQQDQQIKLMEIENEKLKIQKWNGVNSTTVVYGNANSNSGMNINVK